MNKLDEILRKLLGHDDSIEIGNGYHDDCAEEIAEARQAIVEAVLDMIGEDLTYGTESGAVKAVDNEKRRLRKAIEEWQ